MSDELIPEPAEAERPKPAIKPNGTIPADAVDIASLWVDNGSQDPLAETRLLTIPIGKPTDFFRTHTNPEYRRKAEIYVHKSENSPAQFYLIGPAMKGRIAEARPCIVTCVVDRLSKPRLWPLILPRDGERDNGAWETARQAAREALTQWTRLVWTGSTFTTRQAVNGYAPEPDFSKLPSFNELVRLGFGEQGVIRDENHIVYRELFGLPGSGSANNDANDIL